MKNNKKEENKGKLKKYKWKTKENKEKDKWKNERRSHIKIYENEEYIICDGIMKMRKKGEIARTKKQQDEAVREITNLTIDKEEAVKAIRILEKENQKNAIKKN